MGSPDETIDGVIRADSHARHMLFQNVYNDLRRVAAAHLAGEAPGQTLTATALVHEAFLRLTPESNWRDQTQLYRTAVKAIRHILIDAARRKQSLKHGGQRQRTTIPLDVVAASPSTLDPLEFHEALDRLEAANSAAAEVFSLRYFGGLTWDQIAATLGVGTEKVEALWSYARAKLAQSLSERR